ncbi:MAG: HAD-IA family hydrolase [Candidatus Liptonbacteria bacterium]|nr:HAD-IA family hydrolase [Candidatus Liptonbacteria bacterium]
MGISTIIFDFAGVLTTDTFFHLLAKNLSDKFGVNREETEKRLHANEKAYARGEETTEDFWKKCFPEAEVAYEDFVREFASSYELNPTILDMVGNLKRNYHTFLHTDNFEALASAVKKDSRVTNLFENMFFSNEMGTLKDEESSFRHVLKNIGKKGEECIFIDDKEKNLVAPAKLGIHTLLFKGPEQLLIDLIGLGIKI